MDSFGAAARFVVRRDRPHPVELWHARCSMVAMLEMFTRYKGVDWVAMVFAVISLYLLGKHKRSGFLVGLLCNMAWTVFGVMTHSVANILANLIYVGFNLRGWWRWKKEAADGRDGRCAAANSD